MGSATTGKRQKPPEIAVFSIKVERDKLDRFRRACEPKRRSMAQQIRYLIDQDVREFEQDGEAA